MCHYFPHISKDASLALSCQMLWAPSQGHGLDDLGAMVFLLVILYKKGVLFHHIQK